MSSDAILVLHGMSMSGASVLTRLGPLCAQLEEAGFELVAPNGGCRMSAEQAAGLQKSLRRSYEKLGQDPSDSFREGAFWQNGEHFEWFGLATDAATGAKTYEAVQEGIESVARAIQGKRVVGVLGFSQGAAMAVVLAGLAAQGDVRFASLRFGVFIAGFKPTFDVPKLFDYPIQGHLRRLFVVGERDALFPGGLDHLQSVASAFEGGYQELLALPELDHDLPSDPETLRRIVIFVSADAHD